MITYDEGYSIAQSLIGSDNEIYATGETDNAWVFYLRPIIRGDDWLIPPGVSPLGISKDDGVPCELEPRRWPTRSAWELEPVVRMIVDLPDE